MTDDKMQSNENNRPEQAKPEPAGQPAPSRQTRAPAQPSERPAPGRRPLFRI